MLVVSINAESWKEYTTTSISSPQERNCIAELCGAREASSDTSRARQVRTDPAFATRSPGPHGTNALAPARPKTQKEDSCPPTAGKSRKGGTQTLRLLIVRRALIPKQTDYISGSSMVSAASLSLSTILQADPGRHPRVARSDTICAGRGRGSAARGLRPKARSRSHTA